DCLKLEGRRARTRQPQVPWRVVGNLPPKERLAPGRVSGLHEFQDEVGGRRSEIHVASARGDGVRVARGGKTPSIHVIMESHRRDRSKGARRGDVYERE